MIPPSAIPDHVVPGPGAYRPAPTFGPLPHPCRTVRQGAWVPSLSAVVGAVLALGVTVLALGVRP